MNEDNSKNSVPTIFDHLPIILGKAVVETCLSSFPIPLLCYNLATNVGSTVISIRNEKQTQILLNNLKDKLNSLAEEQKIQKNTLYNNLAYQEVANKRLSALSALDSEADLEIVSKLIAIVAQLTGENSKDKPLLFAIGEITPKELQLLQLSRQMHEEFDQLNSELAILERRAASSQATLKRRLGTVFFEKARELLELESFSHVLSRLHSLGLMEAVSNTGLSSYHDSTTSIYPPAITPVGAYLLEKF